MTDWNEPLPKPTPDVIEPPIDGDIETGIEPEEDEGWENPEDENEIVNDEDDEPDEEDIPLVDATESRR